MLTFFLERPVEISIDWHQFIVGASRYPEMGWCFFLGPVRITRAFPWKALTSEAVATFNANTNARP